MVYLIALMMFFASAGEVGPVQAQDMGDRSNGAVIAQRICAECHAVKGEQLRSPNPQAPTFATIVATPGMTSIALTAVLRTPHRNMPNIILADQDLRDVVAYLLSMK